MTYCNFVAKGATGELDLLEHFNKIDIITFLLGRKIFRKSDLALAEERKSDIESYVKILIKLPPKILQACWFPFSKEGAPIRNVFTNFPKGLID